MVGARHILGFCRTINVNVFRSFQTSPIILIQMSESCSRRSLFAEIKKLKIRSQKIPDSFDEDDENLDIHENTLEIAYDERVREVKENQRRMRKMAIKRKFEKKEKQPNMLTWNEREHMKYLHKFDPNEWTPERLSESFPALPYVIKKILKEKYRPDSMEAIKKRDHDVLKNWEKLKKNELDASPAVIEHLKKFIDRRDNLNTQLQNPMFHYLPKQEEVPLVDGPMSSLITNYGKQINMIQSNHHIQNGFIEGHADNELEFNGSEVIQSDESELSRLADEIDREMQIRKPENVVYGRRGKHVTLKDLKKDLLEKTEEGEVLSACEEAIVNKTLEERKLSQSDYRTWDADNTLFLTEATPQKSIQREQLRSKRKEQEESEIEGSWEDEELDYPTFVSDDRTKCLQEGEIGRFLSRTGKTEVSAEGEANSEGQDQNVIQGKSKKKRGVEYYNTEIDKLHYEEEEKFLSQTCFWNESRRLLTKSSEPETDVSKNVSPHVNSEYQTYFTYDYPEKIDIPEDKRGKSELTFRVKDCYYDHDGKFLYRVPGMC